MTSAVMRRGDEGKRPDAGERAATREHVPISAPGKFVTVHEIGTMLLAFPLSEPLSMAAPNHLLNRFPFLDTRSPYDARKKQRQVWGQYTNKVVGKAAYHLLHNRATLNRSAIDYLACSTSVRSEFSEPHDWYWLLLPTSGFLEITLCGKSFTADTTSALLLGPWQRMCFQASRATAIFYGIETSFMAEHLQEEHRDRPGFLIRGTYRNLLRQLLEGFANGLDDWATGPVGKSAHPSFVHHMETAVCSTIAEAVTDDLSGGYGGGRIGGMPITAIHTFLNDNLCDDLSIKEIAEAVGVSVRSLQTGFSEHYFMSPMQMLKNMRLDKARELLKSATKGITIGDICRRVGINHAGRFSKEYAERFGESPSQTLSGQGTSPCETSL
jgi:AraC-like DNA-binding protein